VLGKNLFLKFDCLIICVMTSLAKVRYCLQSCWKCVVEGCYYVSIGVWAYEPKILHTYVIGVYTIDIIYDYRVYML